MPILFPSGFEIVSKDPIDTRLVVSFEDMLNPEFNTRMPDNYTSLCIDNHKLYVYSEENEFIDIPNEKEIGKFRLLDVDYAEWGRIVGDIESQDDLISAINSAVEVETNRAIDQEVILRSDIETEKSRAEISENSIRTSLSLEISRANKAENDIRGDLNTEIRRSSDAEQKLSEDIEDLDDRLTLRVVKEEARAKEAELDLNNRINTEQSSRIEEDNSIKSNLNAEISRATTRENLIASNLSSEIDRALKAESDLDIKLTNLVEAEVNRALAEESRLDSKINKEISDRETAISNLSDTFDTKLSDLDSKIQLDINNISNDLAQEILDRESGDNTLQQNITTEKNRAEAKEQELNNSIISNSNEITNIKNLIPSEASVDNKLADKDFVNSSISTNTANFIGTFNSVDELPKEDLTNNDYAFIKVVDSTTGLVKQYDRYKWVTDDNEWKYEFTLNNSSFTTEQWASINSGATSSTVTQVATNKLNIESLQLDKVDKIEGKELSTNDYTDEDKLKLAGIEVNANKTIIDSTISSESENPVQNKVIKNALDNKSNLDHKHTIDDITDFPNLATVAISGSYNDLLNKPSIPTKTSELTNDSNFGTISEIKMNGESKGTTGVVDLGTVITEHQDISGKQDKLVSNENIKTINGETILGPGNIRIDGAIYTGGDGIDISDENVISVDDTVATKIDLENKANKSTTLSGYGITDAYTKTVITELLNEKQDTLVSGQSIKTINGNSLLGQGDIHIEGSGAEYKSGKGINISENYEISVNDTVAMKTDLGIQLTMEVENKTLKIRTKEVTE